VTEAAITDPTPAKSETGDFEKEAATAGLVLPVRRRLDPWLAVGLIAVLVGASLGVGYATGWLNPSHPAGSGPNLYGPQDCTVTNVPIRGASLNDGGDTNAVAWQQLSTGFANYTGGCVTLTVNSSGGAGGVGAQAAKQVEYTLSSLPPTPAMMAALGGSPIVVPELLGAVGVVYDLPHMTGPLHLSGAVLAGIYSGRITQWNDPAISAINPGADLPSGLAISVTYRNDSNPVNSLFTGYLSTVNSTWSASVGSGSSVAWPTGTPESSQSNLLGRVVSTPGAIGYTTVGLSGEMGLPFAGLENVAGDFVAPNGTTMGAAAAVVAASSPSADGGWNLSAFFTATGASSYPLTAPSYVLLYPDFGRAYGGGVGLPSAEWLVSFLWWVANEPAGSPGLVAQLPAPMVTVTESGLEKVLYNGTAVLSDNESGSEGGETGVF
jgi:phosphate transport system substrate-binding protein